jgi:hypothetical protein
MTDEKANKILAKALLFLLKESEGIAVEVDKTIYSVHKIKDELFISKMDKDEKCMLSGEVITDGQLMWMHEERIH